jgi:hypothetical protein
MDTVIATLMNSLLDGGNRAVTALLLFICYGLWADRSRLMLSLEQADKETIRIMDLKDAKADEVVENYFKSALATAEALSSLKMFLSEINIRLMK